MGDSANITGLDFVRGSSFDSFVNDYSTLAPPSDHNMCPSAGSTNASNGESTAENVTSMSVIDTVVTPVVYTLISVIGVVGNFLVIFVIISREEMRKLTNLMLLNLAISDICFLLITPPFTAYITTQAEWVFGDIFCKIVNCALNLTVYVTVYTLVLICVVRYMAIVHHNWSVKFRTRKNVTMCIISIWIIMFLSVLPFARIFGECTHDGVRRCMILLPIYARNCFTFSSAFAYLIPLTIILCLSVNTYRHINKKHDVVMRDHVISHENRQRQAGRVITCVVLAFAILWLPVHVDILWYYWGRRETGGEIHPAVGLVARSLAYFNSCINPIIYNFTSREFRKHFWEVARCVRSVPRAPSVHSTYKSETSCMKGPDNSIPLLEHKKIKFMEANSV